MKDIEGYEGLYAITEDGRVWSHKSQKFRKLGRSREYLQVSLCKDGVTKQIMVHRLVACAYVDNPENKQTVNHIDGNPHNNHVSNLEWMTMQENNQAAWDNGQRTLTDKMYESMLKNMEKGRKRLKPETVSKIRELSESGLSNRSVAKMVNVAHSTVGNVVNGTIYQEIA